jgi:hypothetical protein
MILDDFLEQPAPCDDCGYAWHCKTNNVMCRTFVDYVNEIDANPPIIAYAWPRRPSIEYGNWRR